MKDEVVGGIKNALERGSTAEEAIKTLVNSGYNEAEVRAAADSIKKGSVTSALEPIKDDPEAEKKESPKLELAKPTKPRSAGKMILIIFLIFLLLMIVGTAVLIFIFPDTSGSIVNSIKNIF